MENPLISLNDAPTGKNLEIKEIKGKSCQKLREMGFCEGLELQKMTDDKCILCTICGTKFAISKELGCDVMINENQSQDL